MHLSELTVELGEGHLQLADPANAAFLRGETDEPRLKESHPAYAWVGRAIIALFGAALLLLIGFTVYTLIWNSSLATTGTAVVQNVKGDVVTYEYVVDGAAFTDVETSSRVSFYKKEGKDADIRYINAKPDWSKLEVNNEKMDWFMFTISSLFAGALAWAGLILLRGSQRAARLKAGATHVLSGELYNAIRGQHGTANYLYRATSPTTGQSIGGMITARRNAYPVPSDVAILFLDDKTHAAL